MKINCFKIDGKKHCVSCVEKLEFKDFLDKVSEGLVASYDEGECDICGKDLSTEEQMRKAETLAQTIENGIKLMQ